MMLETSVFLSYWDPHWEAGTFFLFFYQAMRVSSPVNDILYVFLRKENNKGKLK